MAERSKEEGSEGTRSVIQAFSTRASSILSRPSVTFQDDGCQVEYSDICSDCELDSHNGSQQLGGKDTDTDRIALPKEKKWMSWTRATCPPGTNKLFQGERPNDVEETIIPVVVPMYNEDPTELLLTLGSLAGMEHFLNMRSVVQYTLKVCIVMDGIRKAHKDTVELLTEMFPFYMPAEERDIPWLDVAKDAEGPLTMFLQDSSKKVLTQYATKQYLGDDYDSKFSKVKGSLDVSVIIKSDNRKKHNSHNLFFAGFAAHYNPQYVFATDCGTIFSRNCLELLVKRMTRDRNIVALTGRQRVMPPSMQPKCSNESWFAWMLRAVQGYDYEAATVVFNGCFSLFGILAVIPGPCGLFRLPPLMEKTMENETLSPFEFYINAANKAEESNDMLTGNCVLAEDRVLTFASLFLTNGKYKACWEKHALFYFQSEGALESLVAQRRRWLNGTVASYIYVFNGLGRKNLPHHHGQMKILLTRFFTFLMLAIYSGIFMAPAVYIYSFQISLSYLLQDEGFTESLPSWLIAICCFAIFLVFSLGHHREKYNSALFVLVVLMNMFTSAALIAAVTHGFCTQNEAANYWLFWLQCLVLFYLSVPIVLNLCIPNYTSLKTLLHPFKVLVYLLFLPTFQGYFFAYSIARSFDLSWGNRSGVGGEIDNLKKTSMSFLGCQYMLNGTYVIIALLMNTKDVMRMAIQAGTAAYLLLPSFLIMIGSLYQGFGWFIMFLFILLQVGSELCISKTEFNDWSHEHLGDWVTTNIVEHRILAQVVILSTCVLIKSIRHVLMKAFVQAHVWYIKKTTAPQSTEILDVGDVSPVGGISARSVFHLSTEPAVVNKAEAAALPTAS